MATYEHLVRVCDADKRNLPFTRATLYAWRHRKEHPDIFVTIGGAAFVDLQKLDAMIERNRGARSAKHYAK
jgi:hypothetical protein